VAGCGGERLKVIVFDERRPDQRDGAGVFKANGIFGKGGRRLWIGQP